IAASKTGDDARLSPVDMEILAIAIDVKGMILTDDYSIQNLAKVLGLEYKSIGTKGIKEIFTWKYRCRGCGRIFNENMDDCPICGSALRSIRSKHI
ncbi:MAG: nucleic acid-binding protein, partial [Euryarchaeota archaeon]|nr:nucleic acid-binding protein [Euryarchaeota archaeon]